MTRKLIIVSICLFIFSCSLLDGPESDGEGNVAVHFVRSQSSASKSISGPVSSELARALAVTDSIVCKVFPPSGNTPEVLKGVGFPSDTDTIEMRLTVAAQQNKRVAVELYQAGQLLHFGVDTDVDVAPNQDTYVTITTSPFQVTSFTRDLQIVGENVPFTMSWNRVAGGTAYRLQESATPDFSNIAWQTTVPDTFIPATIPQGEYFFRVRAENDFAASDFGPTQFINVYGAPTVARITPAEIMRGAVDTVCIHGDDLDYPGTQVGVFGRPGNILQAAEDSLCVEVSCPSGSWSDTLLVTNGFGSGGRMLRVQTIAYIMGDIFTGDLTSAIEYKGMIDGYGPVLAYGTVAVLPYSFIDLVDMKEFEVIIVGWDSGTDASDWGGGGLAGQQRADEIRLSGANVLGIGVGGCSYFDVAGFDIGLSQSQSGFQKDIYVVNTSSDIYAKPNPITVPPNRILNIYSLDALQLAIDLSGAIPTDVTAYASTAPLSLLFPFIEQEDTKSGSGTTINFLWGFQSSPLLFTGNGAAIFENSVKYLFDKKTGGVVLPN